MDYTIAETYTLPSLGKIYDEKINPEIKIRSMTTQEEMKRLAKSDRPYKNMSEVIDDCLVESPGISSYDMCVGDYQFLLHKLRVVTYGPEYHLGSLCPYCGAINEGVINLDDLAVIQYTEDLEKYREFDLPVTGKHIKLRIQTPRVMDNITVQARDRKKKSSTQGDFTYIVTLQNLIEEIDGKRYDLIALEDFVSKLNMRDANTILQYSAKLTDGIGIDTSLITECEECGKEYPNSFRFTSEFFGPRVDI